MINKVLVAHLKRKAVVYVRQSTTAQVMDNTESTTRQYGLAHRARQLGWSDNAIEIIDEDLGRSGKETSQRSGFSRLAEGVAHGTVGGIFALEVSRLSRSSQDWQRLLSLCAVAEVIVADETTVYDPKQHDDKLLLDLKGTMSEAELHWLSLRLAGARRSKAARGEMYATPPTGYVWDGSGYVFDPDQSVQQAIQTVFERFAVEPSAAAVVRWANGTGYRVPTRVKRAGGPDEVAWRRLSTTRICNILHNPVYAGAYVYGQYTAEQTIIDGEIITRTRRRPLEDWPVLIQSAHPAYISWETFTKNRRRLSENLNQTMQNGKGAAKQGNALLSGLVICGRCGKRMKTQYGTKRDYYSYVCHAREYGGGTCAVIPGKAIDRAVETRFLEAMAPDELSVSLAVETEAARQTETLAKGWRLRIEQAEYQARLCERRYKAVDPDHRVVARTLEEQWNSALETVEQLKRDYEKTRQEQKIDLSEDDRARIRELASDLPAVWRAKTTRNDERKAMLRLVIEAVAIRAIEVPQRQTAIAIQWKTGATDELRVVRKRRGEPTRTLPEVIERIRDLVSEDHHDEAIAEVLNNEGFQTGQNNPFNLWAVRWVRRRNKIRRHDHRIGAAPLPDRFPDGRYSVRGLMRHFNVTHHVVMRWIRQGKVQGSKHPFNRFRSIWHLELDEQTEAELAREAERAQRRL